MNYTRSLGDPTSIRKEESRYVCHGWTIFFLEIENDVLESKTNLVNYFNCDNIGFTSDYVGCNIEMRPKDITVKFFLNHF
jgi:hypothetical protein